MVKQPRVLLLVETSRAYGRGLLHGIMRYSGLHGPWTFYLEPGGMVRSLPELSKWGADGIIARIPTSIAAKKIIPPGIPAIVIALKEVIPDYPNILGDCESVGKMAAEHLLDRGFKNLAFCGFSDMHWSLERGASFLERVSKAGFQVQQYTRPRFRYERFWNVEQEALADWLKILPKPVGIFACNDDHSQHIAEAAKIAGIYIPDEIAVLGVDNDELLCGLSSPPLSSIALDVPAAGFAAAELLHKMMSAKKEVPHQNIIVHPTQVVTRQSTDVLAVEDLEVAEAIRFIRQSKYIIQVNDVAEKLAMSRRNLELRFRKSLNRSIHAEIRRVKAEQIAEFLLDDSMSIAQIATELGYHDFAHIARFFRKEKGLAPHEFRKKHRHPH